MSPQYDNRDSCAGENGFDVAESSRLQQTQTGSGTKSRKRKKVRENLKRLATDVDADTPLFKRRSSDLAHLSYGSLLDVTPDVSGYILSGA